MSTSVSPNTATRRRAPKLRRWVIFVALFLGALLLFALVRSQGRVIGREFAPSHFHTRSFQFYELPVLQIQITPIQRSGMISPMMTFLRKNSYIPRPKAAPAPDGWHLVSITRGVSGTTPGDAQLLTEHLEMYYDTDLKWKTWSEKHPAEAKILWPIIKRLAERELYVLIPGLFEKAEIFSTSNQFAVEIDEWLRGQYVGLIQDMRAADRNTLADNLLKEALVDFPNDTELKKLATQSEASDSSVPVPANPTNP